MELLLDDHRADAGRLGVVAGSAGRAGPVVVLRLSKLGFVNAESVCIAVGGRECKDSTDGVSCRQRPPTVGENLFETCFGFCVNEIIYNNRLVWVLRATCVIPTFDTGCHLRRLWASCVGVARGDVWYSLGTSSGV